MATTNFTPCSQLASTAALRSFAPLILTEDQNRTIVPSIFAEEAHDVEGEVKANPFTGG
jgi:hypothetical protein